MRGLAYIIPFNNRKRDCIEAQFMPGYKGLVKLAKDSGEVFDVFSRVVYEGEPFDVQEGLVPVLKHTPMPPAKRGKPIGAYTVTLLKNGVRSFTFMWEDEIQEIRKSSKAGGNGPWVTNPDEMRKKTTIRREMKTRDLSPALSKAVALDELIDSDVSSREEFDDDDFMTETLAGKPLVPEPQAKKVDVPVEAEVVEKQKDSGFATQMMDMIKEMGWPVESENRKKSNDIMAKAGLSSAMDFVTVEYESWLKSQGTSKGTTAGNIRVAQ
jgi:recombination protein RecT